MSSPFLDRQAQALERLTSLYSDKPKVIAFIKALAAANVELELALQTLAEQTDIDIARGVNLDTIGEIVGISRIIPESIAVQFFGFDGQAGAVTFGEEGQSGIGARFREDNEPETATSILADPDYRLLIRAKIAKNHGRGTCEDVLAGLNYLFNTQLSVVDDLERMAIAVGIGRQLTFQEKAIVKDLDILPRPAGVRIEYYSNFDYNNYFGFAGQPNAKGFGEEGNPTIGGTFSEEF